MRRTFLAGLCALLPSFGACGPVPLHGDKTYLGDGQPCAAASQCASGRCASGSCAPTWPEGRLGSLVIPAGTTYHVPVGAVLDFADLTIEAGGALEVSPGDGWTFIGCRGVLRLDGELRAQAGTGCGGTYTARAPSPDGGGQGGEALRYLVAQAEGGTGGPGGRGFVDSEDGTGAVLIENQGAMGGAPRCGNGGGGGGGAHAQFANFAQPGGDATDERGGAGGASGPVPGGQGGALGNGGQSGTAGDAWRRESGLGGGGGGGGGHGTHGQGLYLRAHTLIGDGFILANGQAGGAGGPGGSGSFWDRPDHSSSGSGGGGGGGDGGSGGAVVLRYQVLADPALLSRIDVRGGPGGAGGAHGSQGGGEGAPGHDGHDGQPGPYGTVDARQGW